LRIAAGFTIIFATKDEKCMKQNSLEKAITAIRKQHILVLGDLMLDKFIYGNVQRISPEAPVPVVQVASEQAYPGGAANVARNLSDFGGRVTVSGILGNDTNGTILKEKLNQSNISTSCVMELPDFSTIVKTRIIARHQQIVRVDREQKRSLTRCEKHQIVSLIKSILPDLSAIIIEDYGKGFISQSLVNSIVDLAREYRILISVDPNPQNPLKWQSVDIVKPNRNEAFAALGRPYSETPEDLIQAGQELLDKWKISHLLITLGEEGMALFRPDADPYFSPTRAQEVFDVSGAGDTVIAFFTTAMAAGIAAEQSAEIANHAAGVVVGKLGTATLTADELKKSFEDHE
jgi:D-glycero-beta-D-manno-heptose-7-phosphate kinase